MNIHLRNFGEKIKVVGSRYFTPVFFVAIIILSLVSIPKVFAAAVNGLTVTSQLSTDGETVTFSITGVPASGHDAVFKLNYTSSVNNSYAGGTVNNIDTRSIGMPSSQVQTIFFTLPQDPLITAGTLSKNDITYELLDGDGNSYIGGNFADVTPNGPVIPSQQGSGTTTQVLTGGLIGCDGVVVKCGWAALVAMINTAIRYILYLMVPLAAIMFAYAGVLLLTKGSNPAAREKATGIFMNVVIGIVVALAAFLIIKTILDALGVSSGWRIFTQ